MPHRMLCSTDAMSLLHSMNVSSVPSESYLYKQLLELHCYFKSRGSFFVSFINTFLQIELHWKSKTEYPLLLARYKDKESPFYFPLHY